jgi:NADH-quinone oxidoreductase subunit C
MKTLKEHFDVKQKNERLFETFGNKHSLLEDAVFISTQTDFSTLSQIACTDWIEDEIFLLTYMFTNETRSHNLMLKITIGRNHISVPSLSDLFPQAEVMERDLHEMYGIGFDGNDTLYDFVLEGWRDIPPLRREFDTLGFVREHFEFKDGRDDNKDVKVEQKRRREEGKKLKATQETQQLKEDKNGQ